MTKTGSRMPRVFGRVASISLAGALSAFLSVSAHPQIDNGPARFTATAINMNVGAAGRIDIVVNRWSSDAERDKLMNVMLQQGPEKLLDVLQDLRPVGYLQTPGTLRWDLPFARHMPGQDGGERVVLVTDRPIGFREAVGNPRSIDYPFTVIELRLNKYGEGEGKMSVATKIIPDKESNIVTLENYEMQPVQLTEVRRERAEH